MSHLLQMCVVFCYVSSLIYGCPIYQQILVKIWPQKNPFTVYTAGNLTAAVHVKDKMAEGPTIQTKSYVPSSGKGINM